MKWNLFLVIVSTTLLLLFVGAGLVQHMMAAEAIAEDLSAEIGVDEDTIRSHLQRILESGRIRRTVVNVSPIALLAILLTVRLVVDNMNASRTSNSDRT